MINRTMIIPLSCFTILISQPFNTLLAQDISHKREQATSLIYQGKIEDGLEKLKNMLKENPSDQKLLADYIVLSYNNARFSKTDLKYLQQIKPAEFPEYAQINLIKALRDQKEFGLAQSYIQQFAKQRPASYWNVWSGVIYAESQQKDRAKHALSLVSIDGLSADYLSLTAYAYRLLEMPVESLAIAKRAVQANANNESHSQYVLALLANSDYFTADQYIKNQRLDINQPQLKHVLKLNEFSQYTQQAIQYYQVAHQQDRGYQANLKLDEILQEMRAYETQLPDDIDIRRRFYYNYIYALSFRNLSSEALLQIPKAEQPVKAMPPYVRQALAAAYLRERQPKQAESLYTSLLSEKNYADYEVYEGLYYSLIEQEKFREANDIINLMDQVLPTYQYSNAKGVDRTTHSNRYEFYNLKGLNYAYRNELDKAEHYFENLVDHAPNHAVYYNNLAQVQRWREKPQQSEHTLTQWNGVEPVTQFTRINHMQNAQALSDIQEWRKTYTFLAEHEPDDTGVIESSKFLGDRDRATIQHSSSFSKSEADNPDILGRLQGSREVESWTRLNSPWFADNFRGFVDHRYRWAKYDFGKLDDQRIGVGAEWLSKRKHATLLVSQTTDGDRLGAQLGWSHWLNDHWNYMLDYNSQAAIPLQAQDEFDGKSYLVNLNWQAHESRKAGLSYVYTDINDGNLRQELSAYFKQQIFQGPKHQAVATLSGYYGKNDVLDVSYFNPEHSNSFELNIEHNWLTWRHYERNFNQKLSATIGAYNQKNYSTEPIYNLSYQHEWQLSRTWKMDYGIGYSVHPYDGNDEEKLYAVFGFEGRF